ncbi:extensin family protein [Halomonas sp. DP5Y7-2]|uniref:extensin-like domain-containing protein n=1 Tax=Halomonas sp. DP5Y7-2 TaxID=2859076 RepID=UPI001C9901FB|nr:extensin family protein [Halomonas sp. DP5Y7-2]MBY5983819.1 extensin family protein [Halomonas sp. DP5Y7-2]
MIQWLLVMLLVLGIALDKGIIVIPDRYNPWAPISLDASPGPWFRYKLSRLGDDPEACRSVLASDPAQRFSAMEDATVGDCSLTNLVRMQGGDVAVQPPVMTRCPLAVAWAMYERGLSEAASRQLGTGIARIEHMGSFACRNIYGRATGRRSQHATAEALDVGAFITTDGRRISLLNDWGEGAPGRFLKDAGDHACSVFGTVLGPDYNAAHADHFHLGVGGRVCR